MLKLDAAMSESAPVHAAAAALAVAPEAETSVAAVARAAGRWEPRVLVVDDDIVCRLAAQRLLERLGLSVDVAADGRQALEMSASWQYAAVFMDCFMPEVDGYATTRQMRIRDGIDGSPVIIAVTSRPRHVSLASGMDHHIPKPLKLDTLERDCRLLGLLAPAADRTLSPAVGAADAVAALEPPPGITLARAGALALEFVDRALLQLPRLWRAANLADGDALGRLAGDLRQRAATVGARRVAEVCAQMTIATAQGQAPAAAALEPELRLALQNTAREALRVCRDESPSTTPPVPAAADADLPRTVRVAIADDDALARTAISAMVAHGEGLELVGSAADGDAILDVVAQRRPDVVILDFLMPGGGGPVAARRIREESPATRVIALTASESPQTYLEMLRAGASGLLVKGTPAGRLVDLIHRAAGDARA